MCNTSFIAEFGAYMSGQAVGSDIEFVEVPGMGPNIVIRDEEKIAEIQKVVTDNKLLGLICRGVKYVPTEVQTVNNNGTLMTMFKYFLQPSINGDSYSICTVMSNIISLTTTQISRLTINDEATAEDTAWSSNKIEDTINKTITETPFEEIGDMYITSAINEGIRLGEVANERIDALGDTVHIIRFDNTGSAIVGPTPAEAAQAIIDGCVPVMSFSEGEGDINRVSATEYMATGEYVKMKFVSWNASTNNSPVLFIIESNDGAWTLDKTIFHIT